MLLGLYGLHKGDNVDPELLARRASAAEAAGFDSLWVGDHLALPPRGYDPPEESRLEAVVALGHLAAVTDRIRLVFGVLVVPQRHPVVLAKQIASLDVLSRGRVTVGIGVGHVAPELQAFGVKLADRGVLTDEHVEVMRALWSGEPTTFSGRSGSFVELAQRPRPLQAPHPPFVVGGHSAAALRRAARLGHGWFGWALSPSAAAAAVTRLRAASAGRGRRLEVSVRPDREVDLDVARRYAQAGVDRLVLEPAAADGATDELIACAGETLAGHR